LPHFPVSPEKEKGLVERMRRLGIRAEDIVEKFLPSSASGGQRVNKAATCVRVTYLPTGLTVKCQRTRSQGLNRFLALRLLLDKIEGDVSGSQTRVQRQREKTRRQKQRRARRARTRSLARGKGHMGEPG
jgi:protein subunit release factor B